MNYKQEIAKLDAQRADLINTRNELMFGKSMTDPHLKELHLNEIKDQIAEIDLGIIHLHDLYNNQD